METIVVKGRPASVNASASTKLNWKNKVAAAASQVFSKPLEDTDLRIEITFFHDGSPDIDAGNMSKPICDCLEGIVYHDDSQLMEHNARFRDLNRYFYIKGVELAVAIAIAEGEEFVAIKIEKVGEGAARI